MANTNTTGAQLVPATLLTFFFCGAEKADTQSLTYSCLSITVLFSYTPVKRVKHFPPSFSFCPVLQWMMNIALSSVVSSFTVLFFCSEVKYYKHSRCFPTILSCAVMKDERSPTLSCLFLYFFFFMRCGDKWRTLFHSLPAYFYIFFFFLVLCCGERSCLLRFFPPLFTNAPHTSPSRLCLHFFFLLVLCCSERWRTLPHLLLIHSSLSLCLLCHGNG